MNIDNVSFGKVIAVSAKPSKMRRISVMVDILNKSKPIKSYDATDIYRNISRKGAISKAVARGNSVDVYVTDADVNKMYRQEKGWASLKEVVSSKVQQYINAEKLTPVKTANLIINA